MFTHHGEGELAKLLHSEKKFISNLNLIKYVSLAVFKDNDMPDALGNCVDKLWRIAPQPPLGLEARAKLLALGLDLKEEEKTFHFLFEG